ncbi:hypothetical protein [Rhabdochlamydiaceae symbiont of Dictyostelium giganteum]|uniref:hypothetical protein n=1 Tax=Rhabdochlamydiaceae symbiont of Dictyostelium giganteum TaxID=3342349 RepID=UPI00384DA690
MEKIFKDLIELQHIKVRECALALIPHLTDDDLLQPNDFPELENNPYFRHNEGILEGLLTAKMAYQVYQKEQEGNVF